MLYLFVSIMGGESLQQFLTDDDKRAHLHKLLAHRFKAHEQIQLPSLNHYNSLGSSEGLKTVGYEMCRQLGYKPNSLKIHYNDSPLTSGYQVNYTTKTILIDPHLRPHPYNSGAELALAVTAYVLEHLGHEIPDRGLVEFATIEAGLGLWIINAFRPRIGPKQRVYHLIDSSWFHSEGIHLQTYNPRQYVEQFVSFTHENHITADTYLPHTLHRVRYLFPEFILLKSGRHLPEAMSIFHHKRSANVLWAKVILVALIITSGIICGTYVYASRPHPVNPGVEKKRQSAVDLKNSYIDCQNEASKLQSTYDPNDLFMTRQIDDTKSRCTSLRNQYNYAVDQYNKIR